jgi:hypothetical protein
MGIPKEMLNRDGVKFDFINWGTVLEGRLIPCAGEECYKIIIAEKKEMSCIANAQELEVAGENLIKVKIFV